MNRSFLVACGATVLGTSALIAHFGALAEPAGHTLVDTGELAGTTLDGRSLRDAELARRAATPDSGLTLAARGSNPALVASGAADAALHPGASEVDVASRSGFASRPVASATRDRFGASGSSSLLSGGMAGNSSGGGSGGGGGSGAGGGGGGGQDRSSEDDEGSAEAKAPAEAASPSGPAEAAPPSSTTGTGGAGEPLLASPPATEPGTGSSSAPVVPAPNAYTPITGLELDGLNAPLQPVSPGLVGTGTLPGGVHLPGQDSASPGAGSAPTTPLATNPKAVPDTVATSWLLLVIGPFMWWAGRRTRSRT